MSSIKPSDGGGEIDGAEEVCGAFVVACGDRAELLESGEKVLDQVSCPVQGFIVGAVGFSVGFWRDDDILARLLPRLDHPFIGVKGLVSNDRVGVNAGQKGSGPSKVMRLSRRQMKSCGIA